MQLVIHPKSSVFVPSFSIKLSARDKKVIAVALATLGLCVLQFGFSLAITFTAVCITTLLTYLSEKYIRTTVQQKTHWFNTDWEKKELALLAGAYYLVPLVIHIALLVFGIPIPVPQKGIVEAILSHPWKMLGIVGFHAPIVEEILFRGFLFERCEDIAYLLNRHHVVKLSRTSQQVISNVAQGILFGLVHLNRAIQKGYRFVTVASLSLMGILFGTLKQYRQTLIWPMAIHSVQNLRAISYILISAHLQQTNA